MITLGSEKVKAVILYRRVGMHNRMSFFSPGLDFFTGSEGGGLYIHRGAEATKKGGVGALHRILQWNTVYPQTILPI